ncbi:cytochrome P450 [Euzebya sp.]|uniref:cytochrome P450 n=1 Tax=Euzebya sp. TaxID=1971409 RepID=UPI003519A301
MPTSDFDVHDPAFVTDPHRTFDDLRERCPVAWTDDLGGFWMLTRHADIARVTTDTRTWVSSVQNAVPKLPNTGRRGPLHFDPPEHTAYRRALNPVFAADRVAEVRPAIDAMVHDLTGPFVAAGGGDVVAAVIRHVPIRALCLLLGIPPDLADDLLDATVRFVASVHDVDPEETKAQSYRIYDRSREILRDRARRPLDDDGLSAMLSIELDGRPLDEEMAVGTLRQVVVAAHVGPVLGLAGIVMHLGEDRALQDRLRADPALRGPAVEELLRLHAPNTGFTRTPTCPVELHGRVIEVDQPVAVNYAAASRDPDVFTDPDAVDLDRGDVGMAFGHGIHKCIGQHLARAQLHAVVDELLDTTDAFALTVPRDELGFTQLPEHGPLEVPLAIEPRTG